LSFLIELIYIPSTQKVMRLFNVEEANALIPTVKPILLDIQRLHAHLLSFQGAAQQAAEGAERGGGGMAGSKQYVKVLLGLAKRTGELDALGIQLKDYSRGLIDFPAMREGRVVLLCWQLGEAEKISFWHDVDAGFAGRQPL
jgi:hypothetical protein